MEDVQEAEPKPEPEPASNPVLTDVHMADDGATGDGATTVDDMEGHCQKATVIVIAQVECDGYGSGVGVTKHCIPKMG